MISTRTLSHQARKIMLELYSSPSDWRHGYELSKATSVKSGALYPILIRLSGQGLLEAKWEEAEKPGRPPRHFYRLTAAGRQCAAQWDTAGGEWTPGKVQPT